MDVRVAHLIELHEDAERARARDIHRAWDVYEGAKKREPLDPRRDSDEIRLNLAGLIVDAGVDFLFGQDLAVDLDDTPERSDIEDWLAAAWGHRMMLTLQAAATHGAVSGHAVARIIPVDGADPRTTPPRVVALDPANYSAIWDPADIGTLWAQVIRWETVDARGKHVAHRQVLEPAGNVWIITEQESGDATSGRWVTTGEVAWPHAWSPIVDTQNLPAPGRYYGRPDLTADVLDTQDAVNASLSRTSRKDRLQNQRLLVAKGFDAEESGLTDGVDLVQLPDEDSELTAVDAATGQVRDSLELYRTVKAALHEISRVPEIAAGRLDNIGNLSGLALQILYGPLIRKTETKRRTYGALVSEVSARLLEIAGYGDAADQRVALRWPAVLPTDDEAEARTAQLRQDAGVSVGTTLAEMGYDPAAEAEARGDEALAVRERAERAFDRGMDA